MLFILRPNAVYVYTCVCSAVQAASGNGGGIAASVAGDRALRAISTTFTNNSAVSGGALYVTGPTNGVAVGGFSCEQCTLKDNRASSKVGGNQNNLEHGDLRLWFRLLCVATRHSKALRQLSGDLTGLWRTP
jgi:predicted outer membrane repeat protein